MKMMETLKKREKNGEKNGAKQDEITSKHGKGLDETLVLGLVIRPEMGEIPLIK